MIMTNFNAPMPINPVKCFPQIMRFDLELWNTYTDEEFLLNLCYKIKEIVESQNGIIIEFNKILEFVNTQIELYTREQLTEWLNDGTLEGLIAGHLDIPIFLDNVAEMIESNIPQLGNYVRTGGYYTINDGGGGLYYIQNSQPSDKFSIKIKENLYAVLIDEGFVNIKQCGHVNDLDIQPILDMYKKLYIPKGMYTCTKTINLSENYEIYGNGKDSIIIHSQQNIGSVFSTDKDVYRGCKIHDLQLTGGYAGSIGIKSGEPCCEFYNLYSETYIGTFISIVDNGYLTRIRNCELYGRLINKQETEVIQRSAIIVNCNGGGVYITDNDIVGYTDGVKVVICYDIKIINNNISECAKSYFPNTTLESCKCINIDVCTNVSIKDNYIENFDENYINNAKNIMLETNYINVSTMNGFRINSGALTSIENTFINIVTLNPCLNVVTGYGYSICDVFSDISSSLPVSNNIALLNNEFNLNNIKLNVEKVMFKKNNGTTFTNGGIYTLENTTSSDTLIVSLSESSNKIELLNNTLETRNIYLGSTEGLMIPLQALGVLVVYRVEGRVCYYHTN